MKTPQVRNEDGSYSDAQPIGWQGGPDWEVYRDRRPMEAVLYDEDVPIAVVRSRFLPLLAWRMRRARQQVAP